MQVFVSSADDLPVTIAEDSTGLPASARWTIAETTGWNLTAMFTFTPTAAEAGSNYVVSLHAVTPSSTNVNTWALYVPTDREQRVVVSEFLANPSAAETAPHFNPLRRAEPSPNPTWHDEFVEIVNASNHEMDLSNWTISDSTAVRHRFPEEYGLRAWGAIVVYGGPKIGFAPGLSVPSIWASVSEAGLGLNNTGVDAILLRNAQGRLISRVVYPPLSTFWLHDAPSDTRRRLCVARERFDQLCVARCRLRRYNFSEPVGALVAPRRPRRRLGARGKAVLTWSAEKGRNYSVVRADSLTGTFAPVATGLRLPAVGRHVVENQEQNATRFSKSARRSDSWASNGEPRCGAQVSRSGANRCLLMPGPEAGVPVHGKPPLGGPMRNGKPTPHSP